jgi:hypothetical protein
MDIHVSLAHFFGRAPNFHQPGFLSIGLGIEKICCWLQPIPKVQGMAYMDGNLHMGALICAKKWVSALISTRYFIGIRVTLTNVYIGIIRNLKGKKCVQ